MFFLIIQLFKIEYKEDIILALTSCGIKKGSIFEGQNLDKVLQHDFPLFTGLIRSEDEKARYSHLITAVVDDKKKVKEFIHLLEEADIEVKRESILRLILLPVETVLDNDIHWEKENDKG